MARIDQVKEIKNFQGWWIQILFWRSHLDVFIEQFFGVKLKDVQKVCARAVGRAQNIKIVKSRGFGKTWLIAWCAVA